MVLMITHQLTNQILHQKKNLEVQKNLERIGTSLKLKL